MEREEKIGTLIYDLSTDCENLLKKHIKTKKRNEEATVIAYYLSVIEYTKTIGILVRNKKFISIPLICRSVLEAIIDILNLTKDSDYYYVLRKISLRNSKKRAESWFKNRDNLLHPDIERLPESFSISQKKLRNELKSIEKILDKYSEEDITDLRTRFIKAGLEDYYESVFWLTSPEIHNDLTIVWERHISDKGGNILFHSLPKGGIEMYDPHINMVNTFLIGALGDIFEKYSDTNFNKYFPLLEKKRKEIEQIIST